MTTPGTARARKRLGCALVVALSAWACAGAKLTPSQQALVAKGDCAALLLETDRARADHHGSLATALAKGCPQNSFLDLVNAATPEDALLWCGRARASIGRRGEAPACDVKRISLLREALKPKVTLGTADEGSKGDPRLLSALQETFADLNLLWDPIPDVIVGKLVFEVEIQDSSALGTATDHDGKKRKVPATAHRKVAHCQADVGLAGRTRTLRATAEARDTTWEAVPKHGVAAKVTADLPTDDDLKQQAAVALLRVLAKALAVSPPETVDLDDKKGCVAYGLALNATSGDAEAAANGRGDPDYVAECETLLGVPKGAGIPVP